MVICGKAASVSSGRCSGSSDDRSGVCWIYTVRLEPTKQAEESLPCKYQSPSVPIPILVDYLLRPAPRMSWIPQQRLQAKKSARARTLVNWTHQLVRQEVLDDRMSVRRSIQVFLPVLLQSLRRYIIDVICRYRVFFGRPNLFGRRS